jgi:ATP-binding cassette subfamily F protein 3
MLHITDLSFAIEGRPLFQGASAYIPTGHKVGLIGRNGTGKTTLFKLIRGELQADGGQISLPARARIGGVAQEVPSNEVSLIDTVLAADTERAALLHEADTAADPARIAEIQNRLADIGAWSAESRAATILAGMGFDHAAQQQPCSAFSGGWRMRVALAAVLFSAPDYLLLDEPTNYLDLEGALWLENYLARYEHTVIIISHDRGLLNRAVGSILHLENRGLTYYSGPYDQFARQRAAQRAVQTAQAKKQEARRAHLQSFVDRFKAKASKAKQAQSRVKMLEKMETIRAPEDEARTRFAFPEAEELASPILTLDGVSVGYDGKPVLKSLNLRIDQDDRIALLGKNGEGKTTLAKLLSDRLKPMAGSMTAARKLRVGFFAQHQVEELDVDATPLLHLVRERPDEHVSRLRARLAGFGLGPDQAETPVGRLSGGQKARLSLLLATLPAPHLLILDEPTNHLDIESREALVEALNAYAGAVILVSHDMHLLSMVADRLWLVQGGAVRPYEDDLEAYRQLLLKRTVQQQEPAKAAVAASAAVGRAGAGSSGVGGAIGARPAAAKRPGRDEILALRRNARALEERVAKLTALRDKITATLANPDLYAKGTPAQAEDLRRKLAEVGEALEQAELRWMAAMEQLEAAA